MGARGVECGAASVWNGVLHMSTDPKSSAGDEELARQTRDLLLQGAKDLEEQLTLLPDAEAVLEARAELGQFASRLTVARQAGKIMESRAGRPKGSRNKRTAEFRRYILAFGQDPAITLMQIQSTPPELLIARSSEEDSAKRRMTYGEAQALRVRCAEGLMPFIHAKQPVAVDMSFSGLSDLIIAGVTHSESDVADILDADFIDMDHDREDGE